ncbi:nuclear mitotic apparatus protein 1 [Denticeps clupeoides]|uniref:nuclear mitotic apparatus protein 1 n=1 Tax=Denticeps clupeoides TaxID=299321 RepID=UPI0010A5533F|nr:nuclear mitotic apparatus protein 1 [Denticeps clupeoides]
MALNSQKEIALLAMVNSIGLDQPLERIYQLADGCFLLKFVDKLRGQDVLSREYESATERLNAVSAFLEKDCHYTGECGVLISWQNILEGKNLDVELAKVVLLLCHHGVMNDLIPMNKLEYKAELDLVCMFRFVMENESNRYLSDNLESFLTRKSMFNMPSTSYSSLSDDWSPVRDCKQRPAVQFLELNTVASSSVSSPMQDLMNTPQFQLRRLRSQLAQEAETRDELERELSQRIATLQETESKVSQLHHRIQKLLRDQGDQEREHKAALVELQDKNENLLNRLHEVLKQSQDLKTYNTQMERKMDELTENNGTLSERVRHILSSLTRAEEEVAKLGEEQTNSQEEWIRCRGELDAELRDAISQKEYLSEQVQILMEKVSALEEELKKAQAEPLQEGEVMGPIMEWEQLKQELADLGCQHSQLQKLVSLLKSQKSTVESQLVEQRVSYEKETLCLKTVVDDLQQSISDLRVKREALEQESEKLRAMVTVQTEALQANSARLQHLETQLLTEKTVSADLLVERSNLETKVVSLEASNKQLHIQCQTIQDASESKLTLHMDMLSTVQTELESSKTSLIEYELKLANQKEIMKENLTLKSQVSDLEESMLVLQSSMQAEQGKCALEIATKTKEIAQMNEQIQKMLTEFETLSQELHKLKEQKLMAENYTEQLVCGGQEAVAKLTEAQNQAILTENEIERLRSEIHSLSYEKRQVEEQSQRELGDLKIQVELLLQEKDKVLVKLGLAEKAKENMEYLIKDQKNQLSQLQMQLQVAASLASAKESELSSLHEEVLKLKHLQSKTQESLKSQCQKHEQNVAELQAQVNKVSNLCSEKNEELSSLHTEIKHKTVLILNAQAREESQKKLLEEEVAGLQDKVKELLVTTTEKESLLNSLYDEIKGHKAFRIREQEIEADQRRQNGEEICHLKAKLQEMSSVVSVRESELCTLRDELKDREEMWLSAHETLNSQKKELELEISHLQAQVDQGSALCCQKEEQLSTLQNEMIEKDNTRLRAEEAERSQRQSLEIEVTKLQTQVQQVSALCSQKEDELYSLHKEIQSKDQACLLVKEAQESQHKETEMKIADLKVKIQEMVSVVSDRESQLTALHDASDCQKKELDKEIACLKAKVQEASTLASSWELELHNELQVHKEQLARILETEDAQRHQLQKEVSRLQAVVHEKDEVLQSLSLEMNKRDEIRAWAEDAKDTHCKQLEAEAALLQAKILELSALASTRESELTSLQNEFKQSEAFRASAQECDSQRRELEKVVDELNAKVQETSAHATAREFELNTLHDKLKACEEKQAKMQKIDKEKRKNLEKEACDLQAQVQQLSAMVSVGASEINSLCEKLSKQKELYEAANNAAQTKTKELESSLAYFQEKLDRSSQQATVREEVIESLGKELNEIVAQSQQKEEIAQREKKDLQRVQAEVQQDQERDKKAHHQELEFLKKEKERLVTLNKTLQRGNNTYQELGTKLERQLAEEQASLFSLRQLLEEHEKKNSELNDNLLMKTEVVEHYKAQLEKAKTHYNGKKQQLIEAQEKSCSLQASLENSQREVDALKAERKLLVLELEQAKVMEKSLATQVSTLQTQVTHADGQQQNVAAGSQMRLREAVYLHLPEKSSDTSSGSLNISLDDSLNNPGQSALPEESSTPLVRSSERLAAKRRALVGTSLETLYFTPMGRSHPTETNRELESSITSLGGLALDSTKKTTKHRRKTQIINITMTKTPRGACSEEGEEFFSLNSVHSRPIVGVQHSHPISKELFTEPSISVSDQLLSLPGYRRSNVHSNFPTRTTSTFCVGAENEPEHSAEDWMRIAELQTRNQACLPHLKSSYPLESRPSIGNPSFLITDDDLRTGDPKETIRRASMMPEQLLNSVASHRLSLAPGYSAPQGCHSTLISSQMNVSSAFNCGFEEPKTSTDSNTASTRTLRGSLNKNPPLKRQAGNAQGPDTPETKKVATCFPRPMTPKDRNAARLGSQNRPPASPAERRQSIMFCVGNTPKRNSKSSILQRGMNKIRSSGRKSPSATPRPLVSQSPYKAASANRKSPRHGLKSPKIASSAKKVIRRMKM